jgi:branched-chain amino acid transport system permease protein
MTLIYVMLAQSLSLIVGFAGMVSLSHAGFYGIGAYTTALLSVSFRLPFPVTLAIAIFVCGLIALSISSIALRTVEDYFIICTLGVQVILFSLMNNLNTITNGPLGISNIPSIDIFNLSIHSKFSYFLLCMFFALIIYLLLKILTKLNYGRILIALSEDEIYSQSIGKNVLWSKIIAFTLSSMLAAIPGVLYAHYISYIDPSSFTLNESIFILSIVIIGGKRKLWRIVFSSAFLILLPEALRFIGLPNSIAANLRQIIYGIILILVIFKSGSNLRFQKLKDKRILQLFN